MDGTTSNTEGQDYFGEFAQESNLDIGISEALGDETSCHDELDFLDHTLEIRVVCTHSDTESQDHNSVVCVDTWGADESEHSVVTKISSLTEEVVLEVQC